MNIKSMNKGELERLRVKRKKNKEINVELSSFIVFTL